MSNVPRDIPDGDDVYRSLFDQVPVPYHELDAEGIVRRVNGAECVLLGYDNAAEILGRHASEFVAPEDREASRNAMQRKLAGLEVLRPFRRPFVRRDGTRIIAEVYESLALGPNDRIDGIRSVLIDITQREEIEKVRLSAQAALETQVRLRTADLTDAIEQLKRSEENFRLLFASNPQPMWVYDSRSLNFVEVNEAAIQQYGYSRDEFLNMRITDIRPAGEVARLEEHLRSNLHHLRNTGEWRHTRKDGSVLDVQVSTHAIDLNGWPVVLTLAIDVTEQKKLQHQLRQSQKMEAVGRLAGGVAHDFNNLLTIITGYGTMLSDDNVPPDASRQAMEQILRAADRAAALTKQLLAFSRQQNLELRVVDLNEIMHDIDKLARRLIGEDVEVLTKLKSGLTSVKADANQIEQVLLNLLVNARDAMPHGGKITIETGEKFLDESYAAAHGGTRAGHHVFFAISDTGVGMDAETQAKIFEPFFTTKDVGKGTGLGLSTVYGIVKQHNGNVSVYSEPGVGTTFKIYLPAVDRAADQRVLPPPTDFHSLGGKETILLVEDDDTVRDLATKVLSRLGYDVIAAGDGRQALTKCGTHGGAIDLLFTDVVMPGMDGRELAQKITELRPTIRTLFTSGYTGESVHHRGLPVSQDTFLQKPYSPPDLAKAVRRILGTVPAV